MTAIIHVQPALPTYRRDFFARLADRYGSRFHLWYSAGSLGALTDGNTPEWSSMVAPLKRFPGGLEWQPEVAFTKVESGDIVVLSGNPRQLSTLVLMLRARISGARIVWWGHYWSSTSRQWRQSLRFLPMRMADALLFYTDEEVAQFEKCHSFKNSEICVAALNNGLNIVPIEEHRAEYNAERREKSLLFIGRLTRKSQFDLILHALAIIGTDAPHVHVVGDGDLRTSLMRRAEALGVANRITWHGALILEEQIASVANLCQAFVYPGEVGLSLIHAMAYRLPVIVHDERRFHMPEIAAFSDDENGMSFVHGDSVSLASTIQDMLGDSKRLNDFSVAAGETVGPTYTTEDMANRFVDLVSVLEERL